MNIIIKTNYNDTEIVGEIIKLNEFQIRVAITSPYINWENGSSINGPGRQSKNNFLHRYEEVSKFLLIETYRKLAIIDKNLDRMCGLYDRLIEENKELKKLPESELRESISRKLVDWFFTSIFSSSSTGLHPSIFEHQKIFDIIETYKKENRKIFLE